MSDLISRAAVLDEIHKYMEERDYTIGTLYDNICEMPPAQSEIIRCKDCKHRPTGENRDDLEFPDEICPCQCEDFWYNWKPKDEWYCGNGERNG